MRRTSERNRFLAVRVVGALLGIVLSPAGVWGQESTDRLEPAATSSHPVLGDGPSTTREATGRWKADLESRIGAAVANTERLLASEEARLAELARSETWSALEDGRASAGQLAAQTRLWDLQIQELEATARKLREQLKTSLQSLEPRIAELVVALSGPSVVPPGPDDTREEEAPPEPTDPPAPPETYGCCSLLRSMSSDAQATGGPIRHGIAVLGKGSVHN